MNDEISLASVDLNLLVNLWVLVEEKSVTHAADRLGLSQPAMSHSLRRIRRLFGDEILVRSGNTNVLTPRAQALVGPLRRIIKQTTALLNEVDVQPETSTRTVKIAASSSVVYGLGPHLAQLLAQQAPHMKLEMIVTEDRSDAVFTEGRADVLLLAQGYASSHPRERLFEDEWVVIGGDRELVEGDVLDLLDRWPHVGLAGVPDPRPYQELRGRGISPQVSISVSDRLLIPHFVAGHRRLALHRRSVMGAMSQGRDLWVVDFPFPILGLGVDMVCNPWLGEPRYWAWLRETLLEAAAMSGMNGGD